MKCQKEQPSAAKAVGKYFAANPDAYQVKLLF